tara:strand:- start:1361 stop:2170 length:810 start_codon:yes stop_codon:yes gene_type:complete
MDYKSLIEVKGLSFSRGDRLIFDELNLSCERGKITAILGPSGSGKTTLLRMIGGQIRPSSGTLRYRGRDISAMSRLELFELRKNLGMLFQSSALFTDLSVFENVAFPLRRHTDLSDIAIRDLVLVKLNAVGLRGAASLQPDQLSGGMARRVALARATVLDPDLLLYDEPFTGQDPISMGIIISLIKNLNKALNATSIIVSHDVSETLSIADYAYLIYGGSVVAQGNPTAILGNASPRVRQFVEGTKEGPVPFHFPAEDFWEQIIGSGLP